MFKIDSNQTIRVSRGDDFYFPLFVNQGEDNEKFRYYFTGKNAIVDSSSQQLSVHLDSWVFVNYLPSSAIEGNYIFTYSQPTQKWKLNGSDVVLSNYGISYTGTPVDNDFIKIVYSFGDGCEVYFEMYFLNNLNNPFFTKTFTSKNDLWVDTTHVLPVNGDMKITVLHTDLTNLAKPSGGYLTIGELLPDQYVYKISGKILDKIHGTGTYTEETLTNRNKIWIIGDDYSNRIWS